MHELWDPPIGANPAGRGAWKMPVVMGTKFAMPEVVVQELLTPGNTMKVAQKTPNLRRGQAAAALLPRDAGLCLTTFPCCQVLLSMLSSTGQILSGA